MSNKSNCLYNAGFRLFLRKLGPIGLCLFILCGLNGCFETKPTQVTDGGGVETTDGEIIASVGMLQGIHVRMVPDPYNPLIDTLFPESLSTLTDAVGKYHFKSLPAGRYNLEAWQPRNGTRLLSLGQVIPASTSRSLPMAGLERTGKLQLNWEGGHHGYLFIPGTTIRHHILPNEVEMPTIILDSLPAGLLPPILWSQTISDTLAIRISDSLTIIPDSLLQWTIFNNWNHQGIWYINTSATGAGIKGQLSRFPMLIRLQAPDFDFSQANPDGSDIRFSDSHGKEITYEIERWDTQAGLAEIWVNIPNIDANSVENFFQMYWGNPEAGPHSSGAQVFNSKNNFSAVLHLKEIGNARAAGYADATGLGHTGTGIDMNASNTLAGAIGLGQNLNGSTQWINVTGNFPIGKTPRNLSGWGKLSDAKLQGHLAEYGSFSNLATFGLWISTNKWGAWHWGLNNDIISPLATDINWHLISLDYNGTTSRLYVDGALVASGDKVLATTANGFTIGASYIGDYRWTGLIDEIEVATVSRSADWIKLAFENQRQGSTTLRLLMLK
jgi:hypothetical protein